MGRENCICSDFTINWLDLCFRGNTLDGEFLKSACGKNFRGPAIVRIFSPYLKIIYFNFVEILSIISPLTHFLVLNVFSGGTAYSPLIFHCKFDIFFLFITPPPAQICTVFFEGGRGLFTWVFWSRWEGRHCLSVLPVVEVYIFVYFLRC